MTLDPKPDLFHQASDYALGLLQGEEKQAFEAALARDPELAQEVERCAMHFEQIGMEREDITGGPSLKGLLWRELWGENWMPWRRRMRLWEFALGGIAAALLAYVVYSGSEVAPNLEATLSAPNHDLQMQAVYEPSMRILHVQWRSTVEAGMTLVLWAGNDADKTMIGALKNRPVHSFKLSKEQQSAVKDGALLFVSTRESNADISHIGPVLAKGGFKLP